ncbi:MAG: hypothetical protein U1C73_17765 [Dietzia sp.]|nr:hypothetical protein [Dietzia sp.]
MTTDAGLTREQLTTLLAQTLNLDASVLIKPEVAIGDQLQIESSRMIELAIVLEEDLGVSLPDDIDLRRESIATLHNRLATE